MNVDVRIYDRSMQLLGFCSGITSLQWNRKYNTSGSFEIHCAQENAQYVALDHIVWLYGASEAGVIETIKMSNTSSTTSKREMVIKGRFLDSYMDRRLVKSTYNVADKSVAEAMQECFSNAVSLGDHISIGTVASSSATITLNESYASLLTVEQTCAAAADLGIRFRPDFAAKKIYFDIYAGVDRTVNQSDRARVVFAPAYKNLNGASYEKLGTTEKTVCYVGGSGTGTDQTVVTAGDDTLTGLDRKEVYLSATDVTKTSGMTDAQYQAALKARGEQALTDDIVSETFDATIEPNGNFVYKKDYDLGDMVTVQYPDWGLSVDKRLTEISEVYERGALTIKPKFGKDALISILGKAVI